MLCLYCHPWACGLPSAFTLLSPVGPMLMILPLFRPAHSRKQQRRVYHGEPCELLNRDVVSLYCAASMSCHHRNRIPSAHSTRGAVEGLKSNNTFDAFGTAIPTARRLDKFIPSATSTPHHRSPPRWNSSDRNHLNTSAPKPRKRGLPRSVGHISAHTLASISSSKHIRPILVTAPSEEAFVLASLCFPIA